MTSNIYSCAFGKRFYPKWLKVRSHQTRINRKLDAWIFWVYSLHSLHNRREFVSWEGLLPGSSSLVAKCIPVSIKVRSSIVQLRVPTYNHNYFVLHCCFGFSASARNDVTARASSRLVNAARISAKIQIFQLARKKRSIRAASFTRIAPQDCLSRLCIDLTCKSFERFASFASGVNAPVTTVYFLKDVGLNAA